MVTLGYQVHNKRCFLFPEVVRAMTFLIEAGMVMYWGSSRWTPFEIFESYSVVSLQYQNLYFQGDQIEFILKSLKNAHFKK